MKCNQCEYLFINGIGCHETGCPNSKKKRDCFECGFPMDDDGCDCMQPVEEVTQ